MHATVTTAKTEQKMMIILQIVFIAVAGKIIRKLCMLEFYVS